MSIHQRLDHGTIEPFAGLSPCDLFDSEDDEAGEAGLENHNFGSILGVGARKPKKRPVLMLDPEEAKAAAIEFQQVAAFDFANGTTSAPNHDAPGLSAMKPGRHEPELDDLPPMEEADPWPHSPAPDAWFDGEDADAIAPTEAAAVSPGIPDWTAEPALPQDEFAPQLEEPMAAPAVFGLAPETDPEPEPLAWTAQPHAVEEYDEERWPAFQAVTEADAEAEEEILDSRHSPALPDAAEVALPAPPPPMPRGHGLRADIARARVTEPSWSTRFLRGVRALLEWAARRWL